MGWVPGYFKFFSMTTNSTGFALLCNGQTCRFYSGLLLSCLIWHTFDQLFLTLWCMKLQLACFTSGLELVIYCLHAVKITGDMYNTPVKIISNIDGHLPCEVCLPERFMKMKVNVWGNKGPTQSIRLVKNKIINLHSLKLCWTAQLCSLRLCGIVRRVRQCLEECFHKAKISMSIWDQENEICLVWAVNEWNLSLQWTGLLECDLVQWRCQKYAPIMTRNGSSTFCRVQRMPLWSSKRD